MNKEDILKAIMELPKVVANNPISTKNGINVEDLMNAIDRLNKVPDYNDLLKENKQLKERIEYLERNNNRREDTILEQRQRISDLEDNWDKLKEYLITDIKYWQKQEREWIKLGFINFGGEANAKIIFKKVLDIMEDLEKGSDDNVRMEK